MCIILFHKLRCFDIISSLRRHYGWYYGFCFQHEMFIRNMRSNDNLLIIKEMAFILNLIILNSCSESIKNSFTLTLARKLLSMYITFSHTNIIDS